MTLHRDWRLWCLFGFGVVTLNSMGALPGCDEGTAKGDEDNDATCEEACDHVYGDCDLVFTDEDGEEVSEEDCPDSCELEDQAVVNCFAEVECDEDEVTECLEEEDEDEEGDEDEDDADDDDDDDEDDDDSGSSG